MTERIKCPHCKGHGKVKLGRIYQDTLEAVRRFCRRKNRYVVANRDHEWFDCTPTALNNRLARLEDHGFLVSEWYGRQRRYRPVEAK